MNKQAYKILRSATGDRYVKLQEGSIIPADIAGQPEIAPVDHRPLVDALMKIASWSEGDEVSGHFDEPSSATIARKALATVGIVGGVK